MCGIVGAVSNKDVKSVLIEGLKRLEYRGYDSAGVAAVDSEGRLQRWRAAGKVVNLAEKLQQHDSTVGEGGVLPHTAGIAHTRWATHGKPTEANAHPHVSGSIAVVHNGIIENHAQLRTQLQADGFIFNSDTDTEVIAHGVTALRAGGLSLLESVQRLLPTLEGAYGTVIMDESQPDTLVVARSGSPLVIGLGQGEHFIASDAMALADVASEFMYLEEGDVAEICAQSLAIFNAEGQSVERAITQLALEQSATDKGGYRHYMLKEIMEQPQVVARVLEGRLAAEGLSQSAFEPALADVFKQVRSVTILACGTSYNAGMVARYWIEQLAGIPCHVEVASEFRYRSVAVADNSLLITISQSGETADTLAGLRKAKAAGFLASLTICNVPGSSLDRESDFTFISRAGTEVGVASTKAFTAQLVSLLLVSLQLGRLNGLPASTERTICTALHGLAVDIESVLELDKEIEALASSFANKHHALYLGRGEQYPIAMEGALKLKEISYIHAEAYAAGELKHGPLALIDDDMPVVVVAPNNELLDKLRSNIEEVRARGGIFYIFADREDHFASSDVLKVVEMPHVEKILEPILYNIPLQLLSYHVALIKGTDVDQPRNLAKSVTVE